MIEDHFLKMRLQSERADRRIVTALETYCHLQKDYTHVLFCHQFYDTCVSIN